MAFSFHEMASGSFLFSSSSVTNIAVSFAPLWCMQVEWSIDPRNWPELRAQTTIWLCNSRWKNDWYWWMWLMFDFICITRFLRFQGILLHFMWLMFDFICITRFLRFQGILLHFCGYARDCVWFPCDSIKQNYKMRSYLHESIPITKKSVPIHIETQAQGFTEGKAVIFLGWHCNIMTFGKTITSMSRDNGRPAGLRLMT